MIWWFDDSTDDLGFFNVIKSVCKSTMDNSDNNEDNEQLSVSQRHYQVSSYIQTYSDRQWNTLTHWLSDSDSDIYYMTDITYWHTHTVHTVESREPRVIIKSYRLRLRLDLTFDWLPRNRWASICRWSHPEGRTGVGHGTAIQSGCLGVWGWDLD